MVYPIGSTNACTICAKTLQKNGFTVTDHPSPDITCLLLDVPSFAADGRLRNGALIEDHLPRLPEQITVIGGNLKHPVLCGYRCIDLLQDEFYLARNAAITADCALKVTVPKMDFAFRGCRVLILGWGRIGKCLAQILHALGCEVIVAARKAADRAMLCALGYRAVDFSHIPRILPECQILYNTVPEMVLDMPLPVTCIGVELASHDGIRGDNVIIARGLPGKLAPQSAGDLMAQTILRFKQEGML